MLSYLLDDTTKRNNHNSLSNLDFLAVLSEGIARAGLALEDVLLEAYELYDVKAGDVCV